MLKKLIGTVFGKFGESYDLEEVDPSLLPGIVYQMDDAGVWQAYSGPALGKFMCLGPMVPDFAKEVQP